MLDTIFSVVTNTVWLVVCYVLGSFGIVVSLAAVAILARLLHRFVIAPAALRLYLAFAHWAAWRTEKLLARI